MGITKFQFDILDSLADGSEPFSMINVDVFNFNIEKYKDLNKEFVAKVAYELCKMLSLGLVRECYDDKVESEHTLLEFYSELVTELNKNLYPFYYSKGEIFFERTELGRRLWEQYYQESRRKEKPIVRAVESGGYCNIKKLLERGAEANCKDEFGQTPLHIAALSHNKEVIDILLSYGADVNARDKYANTPIHAAAIGNNIAAVKALVEHGAEVNCKNESGKTPLHEAVLRHNKEVINTLLSYGADVNAIDEYANTPLHQAAIVNNVAAAKVLVEHGADVFVKNYYDYSKPVEKWKVPPQKHTMNKTPKEIASTWGYKELTQYLQAREDGKKQSVDN